MSTEIETVIRTESNVRVSISEWDTDGAWLSLQLTGASAHVVLTHAEAETLLAGLQAVLAKEVTA